MSAGGAGRYDPAEHAQRLGVRVVRRQAPMERLGEYDQLRRIIYLNPRLSGVHARCTLAHEVVHAEYGDTHQPDGWWSHRQEARADRLAAERLVDVVELQLACALFPDDRARVAAELNVSRWLLDVALATLPHHQRKRA